MFAWRRFPLKSFANTEVKIFFFKLYYYITKITIIYSNLCNISF